MAHPKDIGIRIRQVRRLLNLNQEGFALKVGVSRVATVSDWERGETIPAPETLRAIAEAAGEDPVEVFGGWATDLRQSSDGREDEYFKMLHDPLPLYHGLVAQAPRTEAEDAAARGDRKTDGLSPNGTSDLVRQLDAIASGPGTPREKGFWTAEVSAAYRSAALLEAEVGARIRAEAMRRAEDGALARVELVRSEPGTGEVKVADVVRVLADADAATGTNP